MTSLISPNAPWTRTDEPLLWLPAQSHSGENIGNTPTHTILVVLKESAVSDLHAPLGPVVENSE